MNKQDFQLDDQLHWYKDAIIYELHIKAFNDANGDGIGDFKGLLEKLDYLQELGVTAIWVLPFYPSPLKDDGYDIADYFSINPRYGNLDDFKRFIDEAHARGLRVITELVVNHTSDQHPWFQRARQAPKDSPHRNYYVWSDDPSKYKDTRIIFTDYEPSNWTWDPVAGQYYWHRFFHHQPDLNYDNPEVQDEVFKMLEYWLDMGVDGFRLDAVPYLFEREGTNCENLPETHVFLKKLRAHVDSKYPGRLLLAEANMWPEDSAAYFGDGDECQMNYHFPIMPRMFMAVKMEDRYPIIDILEQTPAIPPNCQWGMFLRNHDELTLEMVTDEERDYMYRMYAKDTKARINLGIRHRLAPLLDNDRRKIELMNVLLMSMPGTPIIYYGDEIGMGDNFYLGDRDGVRTPMQWSPDRNAGFSRANPQKLYLPVILDPEYSYEAVNVELQERNTNSLLWWMRRLIDMRKRFKVFGRGEIKFLSPQNAKVLVFVRSYEEEHILVIVNLSRYTQPVSIDLAEYQHFEPVEVFSHNRFPKIGEEPYFFTMAPYGYYWLELQPVKEGAQMEADLQSPRMNLRQADELSQPAVMEQFAGKILRPYLKRARWFGGKARTITSLRVPDMQLLREKEETFFWILLEVAYNEGLPELYQMPFMLSEASESSEAEKSHAPMIGAVSIAGTTHVVYDALYSKAFRNLLISKWAGAAQPGQKLQAIGGKQIQEWVQAHPELPSRVMSAEQSNSAIAYDNDLFMKLYRKLDYVINPDVEVSRFLTEKAGFPHTPNYLGTLEWQQGDGRSLMVGMVQEMASNQGDAWEYIQGVLRMYYEGISARREELHQPPQVSADLLAPTPQSELPQTIQNILSGAYQEQIELLGRRTADMHKALASQPSFADFSHEEFSLHYQRSLFSSLQTLTRSSYELLEKKLGSLPEHLQQDASQIMGLRGQVLEQFKQIYDHKITTLKIRTHGDYHLGQVLYTGRDFLIIDFEGEPARAFSERRIRRSPLRDVAGMIRSFHYAAYGTLFEMQVANQKQEESLEQWAEIWYRQNASLYLKAYLQEMQGTGLLPDNEGDLRTMLQTFLLEKAVYEMAYELNNRPDWLLIPIRGIQSILR
ncbi:maltose alpha-D-glucosyltransferase [Cesiribacter andamanensis]|uniref:Maltokinase n=1 Tax=Cesiribacter andamanensis AMV16 TaxID=1279009 RepID=M7NTT5_9BACT|nr:maltose alpha-D-glucosyltransferase [Cesiribacter andamanensis]EMR01884.1 Trehalose synthase/amylase TreS [Cesiribacter andamanensis AMV16]